MCSLYDEHSNRIFITVLMYGHFVNLLMLEFLFKMTDSPKYARFFQMYKYISLCAFSRKKKRTRKDNFHIFYTNVASTKRVVFYLSLDLIYFSENVEILLIDLKTYNKRYFQGFRGDELLPLSTTD